MICVAPRAEQQCSYKEAEFEDTHKKGLFHTWSQSAMEEAALEESEPAKSKEESSRVCTGLEALDWMTSEVYSNLRTPGFQDFRPSGSFVS